MTGGSRTGAAAEDDQELPLPSGHLLPRFASMHLDQIGPEDVDRYKAAKLREGACPEQAQGSWFPDDPWPLSSIPGGGDSGDSSTSG